MNITLYAGYFADENYNWNVNSVAALEDELDAVSQVTVDVQNVYIGYEGTLSLRLLQNGNFFIPNYMSCKPTEDAPYTYYYFIKDVSIVNDLTVFTYVIDVWASYLPKSPNPQWSILDGYRLASSSYLVENQVFSDSYDHGNAKFFNNYDVSAITPENTDGGSAKNSIIVVEGYFYNASSASKVNRTSIAPSLFVLASAISTSGDVTKVVNPDINNGVISKIWRLDQKSIDFPFPNSISFKYISITKVYVLKGVFVNNLHFTNEAPSQTQLIASSLKLDGLSQFLCPCKIKNMTSSNVFEAYTAQKALNVPYPQTAAQPYLRALYAYGTVQHTVPLQYIYNTVNIYVAASTEYLAIWLNVNDNYIDITDDFAIIANFTPEDDLSARQRKIAYDNAKSKAITNMFTSLITGGISTLVSGNTAGLIGVGGGLVNNASNIAFSQKQYKNTPYSTATDVSEYGYSEANIGVGEWSIQPRNVESVFMQMLDFGYETEIYTKTLNYSDESMRQQFKDRYILHLWRDIHIKGGTGIPQSHCRMIENILSRGIRCRW